MTRIHWFADQEGFAAAASGLQSAVARFDRPIAAASTAAGYCTVCARASVFGVGHGQAPGGSLNLRESLCCRRCRLTTRQRLVHLALAEEIGRRSGALRGALLEKSTRLYRVIHARWPWLVGSEFLGPDHLPGRSYWWSTRWWRWRRTRHESITSFSYAMQSLDLLVHSDVLEHVYDTGMALRECARVLRKGGAMLFTVPFAVGSPASVLRGHPLPGGGVKHIESPEYHGDGVRHGGIYTFHTFGWDLLSRMREAGFDRVEIGLCHAPGEGFIASDPGAEHAWMGLPVLFRATR
jgi:SAM-dependent methyltransferase